ncbi:hypothetical protein [Nocardia africana]
MGRHARTYAGVPMNQRRALRKDKLLAAVTELPADRAPQDLTVLGVTKAAGLSPRSLYESFTGLDNLISEASHLATQRFMPVATAATA